MAVHLVSCFNHFDIQWPLKLRHRWFSSRLFRTQLLIFTLSLRLCFSETSFCWIENLCNYCENTPTQNISQNSLRESNANCNLRTSTSLVWHVDWFRNRTSVRDFLRAIRELVVCFWSFRNFWCPVINIHETNSQDLDFVLR